MGALLPFLGGGIVIVLFVIGILQTRIRVCPLGQVLVVTGTKRQV